MQKKATNVIFCSDVHLCHQKWYECTSEDRMENMIAVLNQHYDQNPYEKIIFLGDYSLDFWEWDCCGSFLEQGISNTDNFIKHYARRLKADYYMAPGNHEQYGYEQWKQITGTNREEAFVLGGYLIISCDNFSGLLDPDFHSDGVYVPTNLSFIREKMAEYPTLPVILCGHYFDPYKEPDSFFDFLKTEKRITLLICGHDHVARIEDLGEKAGSVCIYHDGHYSYSGAYENKIPTCMWGFCEATLTENGIDIRYIEPSNQITLSDCSLVYPFQERHHRFFERRDLNR